jgi:hypothetical protein
MLAQGSRKKGRKAAEQASRVNRRAAVAAAALAAAAAGGEEQGSPSDPENGNEDGEETVEERKKTGKGSGMTFTPKKTTGDGSDPGDGNDEDDEEEEEEEEFSELERVKAELAAVKEELKQQMEKKAAQRQLSFPQVPTSAGMASSSRPAAGGGGGTSVYSEAAGAGVGGGSLPPSVPTLRMPELAKMKVFNGEMDSDALDAWIRTLVTQTRYYGMSGQLQTEEAKVAFAAAHLDGAAADWYWSTAFEKVRTLKEFVDAMDGRFKSALDADVAAEKLNSLKQGSHPVTHYVGMVQQLLIRLPGMDMGTRIRSFIRGLAPQLGQKLRELRPKTVEEAYEQAIRVEGSFVTPGGNKYSALSKLNNVETEEVELEEEEKPVTLAAIKRMIDQKWRTGTTAGEGAGTGKPRVDVENVTCFNCGKKGHYKSDCKSTNWKEKIKCHRCNKMGHLMRECKEGKTKETTTIAPGGQGN